MALEAGTYISDLVAANPLAADGSGQGDDHLRLIKSCLKATFPNITGAVTPTHTVLNGLDGRVTAIEGLYVKKDGTVTLTGNLPAGGFKLTGLAAGTVNGDSVRYEQLAAKLTSPLTTRGDLMSRDGSAEIRLAVGTNNQALMSNGTDPVWGDPTAGVSAATSGAAGKVQLATTAETTTGTNATKAVTPAGHAGAVMVPKAWLVYDCGTSTLSSSYGVSGVVRNSAGNITVTFSTAFLAANFCAVASVNNAGSGQLFSPYIGAKTTTTCVIVARGESDSGGGGNNFANDAIINAVFYGAT